MRWFSSICPYLSEWFLSLCAANTESDSMVQFLYNRFLLNVIFNCKMKIYTLIRFRLFSHSKEQYNAMQFESINKNSEWECFFLLNSGLKRPLCSRAHYQWWKMISFYVRSFGVFSFAVIKLKSLMFQPSSTALLFICL